MGSKKMNWKRGLFRIWVVATCVWLPVGIYLLGDNFTAVKTVEHVPPGVSPYECIINRTPCPQWQFTTEPDWDGRRSAFVALLAPPIVVPILGFVLFWAAWLAMKIAKWIFQGFRPRAP